MRAARKIAATALAGTLLATGLGVAGATAVEANTTVTFSSVGTLTIIPASAATLATYGTNTVEGSLGATTIIDPEGGPRAVSISTSGFYKLADTAQNIVVGPAKVKACLAADPTVVLGAVSIDTAAAAYCTGGFLALGSTTNSLTLFNVTASDALSEYTFEPKVQVNTDGVDPTIYAGTVTQTVS